MIKELVMKKLIASLLVLSTAVLGSAGNVNAADSLVVYNATNPKLASAIIKAFNVKHSDISVDIISADQGRKRKPTW